MKDKSHRNRFFFSLALGSFLGMFFGAEMQRLALGIGIGIAAGALFGLLLILISTQTKKRLDVDRQDST